MKKFLIGLLVVGLVGAVIYGLIYLFFMSTYQCLAFGILFGVLASVGIYNINKEADLPESAFSLPLLLLLFSFVPIGINHGERFYWSILCELSFLIPYFSFIAKKHPFFPFSSILGMVTAIFFYFLGHELEEDLQSFIAYVFFGNCIGIISGIIVYNLIEEYKRVFVMFFSCALAIANGLGFNFGFQNISMTASVAAVVLVIIVWNNERINGMNKIVFWFSVLATMALGIVRTAFDYDGIFYYCMMCEALYIIPIIFLMIRSDTLLTACAPFIMLLGMEIAVRYYSKSLYPTSASEIFFPQLIGLAAGFVASIVAWICSEKISSAIWEKQKAQITTIGVLPANVTHSEKTPQEQAQKTVVSSQHTTKANHLNNKISSKVEFINQGLIDSLPVFVQFFIGVLALILIVLIGFAVFYLIDILLLDADPIGRAITAITQSAKG